MENTGYEASIKQIFDELAKLSSNIGKDDLTELARIHESSLKLLALADNLPQEVKAPLIQFAQASANIAEGIILEEYFNPEELLRKLSDTIKSLYETLSVENLSVLQSSVDKIEWMKEYLNRITEEKSTEEKATEETDTNKITGKVDTEAEDKSPSSEDDNHRSGTEETTEGKAANPTQAFTYEQKPLIISDNEIEYIKSFLAEAQEHVDAIEAGLLELEQAPNDIGKINEVFRPFHTIKGMAGFLNLTDIQTLTHELETLLDRARKRKLTVTPDIIDIIFDGLDLLKIQINEITEYVANPTGKAIPQPSIEDFLLRVREVIERPATKASVEEISDKDKRPSKRIGEILVEEGKAAPEAVEYAAEAQKKHPDKRIGQILKEKGIVSSRDVDKALRAQKGQDLAIRVDTQKLDKLVNLVGELVITQTQIESFPEVRRNPSLLKLTELTSKITRDIQEISMSVRMIPVAQMFQKMSRIVRDISRKTGKKVQFLMEGEDTELDKNVIQELTDPLMHMVRNAVDHGIEPPEERLAAGKPQIGTILLRAYHQGGNIVIELSDDGKGLNKEKIIQKGIEKGLIEPTAELTDQQVYNLLFMPGFSTASKITDVSGRGVGLDVVKKNIEKLRGTIDIITEVGKGTTFKIRLPLTLAVIDGMVVRVGKQRFIIPTLSILRAVVPHPDQINKVQNKADLLVLDDKVYPLVKIAEIFDIPEGCKNPTEGIIIISQAFDREFGIVVDEILGQQQVVIKSLSEQIKTVRGISGGTILGDGTIGLIIEPSNLYEEFDAKSHTNKEATTTVEN